jgi:hypothetical protein
MVFPYLNFTSLNFIVKNVIQFDDFLQEISKFPLHHKQILALIISILQATSKNSISENRI